MKKLFKKMILLTFLLILYVYILIISSIPDKITIFEGEDISLKTIWVLH